MPEVLAVAPPALPFRSRWTLTTGWRTTPGELSVPAGVWGWLSSTVELSPCRQQQCAPGSHGWPTHSEVRGAPALPARAHAFAICSTHAACT